MCEDKVATRHAENQRDDHQKPEGPDDRIGIAVRQRADEDEEQAAQEDIRYALDDERTFIGKCSGAALCRKMSS